MAHLQHQQQQQNNNPQQQQQLQQHALSNQQSQSSNHNLHQQDKMGGAGSVTVDGSMSNSFRGNDQVSPFYVTSKHVFFDMLLLLVFIFSLCGILFTSIICSTIFENALLLKFSFSHIKKILDFSSLLFMCTT